MTAVLEMANRTILFRQDERGDIVHRPSSIVDRR